MVTQKDILIKLEAIIEQNEQIILENKCIKEQNVELMKLNEELKVTIETSDKTIHELEIHIKTILENVDKLQDKTVGIDAKLEPRPTSILPTFTNNQTLSPKRHTLILTPTEEDEFSTSTWSTVAKSNISKKLSNVQINKLGLAKNGQCYINFPNKHNQEKAMETLKDDFKVTAETKNIGLTPKITICDLDAELYSAKDQQKLRSDILSKNPEIQNLVNDGKTFDILFIQETQQNTNRAVVRIDPQVLNHLNTLKDQRKSNAVIYIHNSACRYFNRFHIIQCYQCQSFGHRKGSPSCPFNSTNRSTCLYCGQNHPSKDCSYKRRPEMFKCANCTRFSGCEDDQHNLNHTTTDHTCPIFQKQIEITLKNTRGIGQCTKNDFAKHVFIT